MNQTIEQQVNQAIAEGRRVQEAVRDIMLKALADGRLDLEAMRKLTADAVAAVRDAQASSAAKDAVRGIESALAQATHALQLSLQEASGRAGKFAAEDLAKARADMAAVEKMFVDTLSEAAGAARGQAKAILEDLAHHAEASGTAIGRQLHESAERSAQAAAGVLAAMADTLQRQKKIS